MDTFKYYYVFISTMGTQISLKLSDSMYEKAKKYSADQGFDTIQDLVREMLRRRLWVDDLVGIIPNDGKDSVEEVREIRKNLSKEPFDIDEINKLAN